MTNSDSVFELEKLDTPRPADAGLEGDATAEDMMDDESGMEIRSLEEIKKVLDSESKTPDLDLNMKATPKLNRPAKKRLFSRSIRDIFRR